MKKVFSDSRTPAGLLMIAVATIFIMAHHADGENEFSAIDDAPPTVAGISQK